jgi:nitroimidazol reductase NimA-like FMN-containing flavoprotein (pyridoxamine 5'-phosphate oxidase superfamily)
MNGREEVESLLGSRLNLQLATIDDTGYPNIQPVWFIYDNDKTRLYILTSDTSKKTLNIRNNYKVYFSVDDCNIPYKGVKGRGNATILSDPAIVISTANKLSMKYYGSLDSPAAKSLIDRSKQQDAVAIEINPKFFSTWDFGKMQST